MDDVTGDATADIHFWFDPVCPFAWLTSKWVRQVMARRDYTVDWRFISLRLINAEVDYDAYFPPDYEVGHTAGLRLLRVAARTRAEHGGAAVGRLYEAFGAHIFDTSQPPGAGSERRVSPSSLCCTRSACPLTSLPRWTTSRTTP